MKPKRVRRGRVLIPKIRVSDKVRVPIFEFKDWDVELPAVTEFRQTLRKPTSP